MSIGRDIKAKAKRELGQWGEQVSCDYLARTLGWRILARNWRSRIGELDIIAQSRKGIVVVEVRTRSGTDFGSPLESVDGRKRRQLIRLTRQFPMQTRAWDGCEASVPEGCARIDVIGIWALNFTILKFIHLRNAVEISSVS